MLFITWMLQSELRKVDLVKEIIQYLYSDQYMSFCSLMIVKNIFAVSVDVSQPVLLIKWLFFFSAVFIWILFG